MAASETRRAPHVVAALDGFAGRVGGIQFTGAGSTAGVVRGAVLGLRVDCVGVDSRTDGSRAAMLKIIVQRFRSKGAGAGKPHVAPG